MGDQYAERTADSLMIRSDLVARRAKANHKQFILPTEIWVIILKMVIDSDSFCYDYCTSFDFPRFRFQWSMFTSSTSTEIGNQILQLRLVCRLWSILIEPTWMPYVDAAKAPRITSYKKVRALAVDGHYDWDFNWQKPYPLNQPLLGATISINTLMIRYPTSSFSEFLLSYPEYFPNLRSFHYICNTDFPPNFWARLEKAFPRLTALSVFGRGQRGESVTLPHLEILYIGSIRVLPSICHFPSLQHFALDIMPDSPSPALILQNHGKSMESLLLPVIGANSTTFFGEDFWTQFPKLKLLGTKASALDKLSQPSVVHPLHHLCLYFHTLKHVQSIVTRFLSLRYLSVLSGRSNQEETQKLTAIDEFLIKRGARRLEIRLYGRKLDPEIDQLRRHGSWQKATHQQLGERNLVFCTWELSRREDPPK